MKKRILVIEDDAAQRQLFKTALEGAGYEVTEAADGRIGIAAYTAQRPDVVITDIFMPHEDGIETIFELKHAGPGVKIIAISGGGQWQRFSTQISAAEPLEIARRFGADRTLKKPIKLSILLQTVADLIRRSETAGT